MSAPEWPEDKTALLIKLIASGMSIPAISLRMGISQNAIIGKRHRMHLPTRPAPVPPPAPETRGDTEHAHFRELWDSGITVRDLGVEFSISVAHVYRWSQHLHLPRRKAGPHMAAVTTLPVVAAPAEPAPIEPEPHYAAPAPAEAPPAPPAPPARHTCKAIDKADTGPWLTREPRYCGAPTVPGSSWCAECRQRIFVPRRAVRVIQ